MANTHFIDNMMGALESGDFDISKVTQRRKLVKKAVDNTAEKLHHTGGICRKSYIVNNLWEDFINNPHEFKDIIMDYTSNDKYSNSENSFKNYIDRYKDKV